MNKGFTILELFIAIAIIGILSSGLFLARGKAEKKLALGRSIYQLAQDLREVQEMAMGAEEVSCNGEMTHSFGIHFKLNISSTSYYLFADCNADQIYDKDNDKILREVKLEKGVEIYSLSPSPVVLNIVFTPPDPTTFINEEDWGTDGIITFSFNSTFKTVEINSAGRIKIE